MEILRSVLRELPEFQQLLAALDSGQSPAAVSGLGAVFSPLLKASALSASKALNSS